MIAAALAIAGTVADPGTGTTGEEMNRIYTANPDPLQWKSFLFHWSYAFWIAPALLLATYVRGRGRWLANIAAVLGFTGMTTMPGMLTIDYVDSAIGQIHGVAAIGEFHAFIDDTMWGLPAMLVPGLVGFALALPRGLPGAVARRAGPLVGARRRGRRERGVRRVDGRRVGDLRRARLLHRLRGGPGASHARPGAVRLSRPRLGAPVRGRPQVAPADGPFVVPGAGSCPPGGGPPRSPRPCRGPAPRVGRGDDSGRHTTARAGDPPRMTKGNQMQDTFVTFQGWVGSEVRHRVVKETSVASFRVGVTPRLRREGDWVDGETGWYTVTVWRTLADHVRQSIRKGDPVIVSGTAAHRDLDAGGGLAEHDDARRRHVGGPRPHPGLQPLVARRPAPGGGRRRGAREAGAADDGSRRRSAGDGGPEGPERERAA